MSMGFIKIATASPKLEVANPKYNCEQAYIAIEKAHNDNAGVLVLPELFVTGYTCADLFFQNTLLKSAEQYVCKLVKDTSGFSPLVLIGVPLLNNNKIFNCALAFKNGKILGVVPKMYIPNYNEFYEKRWFAKGYDAKEKTIIIAGKSYPFGSVMFRLSDDAVLGAEICEDLWVQTPPSTILCAKGANIIANLSASNEIVTKNEYREQLISMQSAKCICAYAYTSAGANESTTDLVFSGAMYIAENGSVIKKGERFKFDTSYMTACVDVDKINSQRIKTTAFSDNARLFDCCDCVVVDAYIDQLKKEHIDRQFDAHPFVPSDEKKRNERCGEILMLQATALAKRLKHTGLNKMVIGISGGLDSTLALMVCDKACDILNIGKDNIIAVTMPGFGTTDKTYTNALCLIKQIGALLKEINIKKACEVHFQDIGHDMNTHDITYENTQARERTQILMDIANKSGAILVGTGDLSELALGWCTYNGDHMSMYSVNASVPKTLVRHIIKTIALNANDELSKVLLDVLDTPVSPELLPPDKSGNIAQKTEDTLGEYEIHDFILYNFIRFGFSMDKLEFMANKAFEGIYSSEKINKCLQVFVKRFFQSQFKRSCIPDGVKIGSVSLSPRGDWRMPSDANCDIWKELI